MAKSLFEGIKLGFQKAAAAYGSTGSLGQAAGSMWVYTTEYFLPNKQKFQVDGGRYGQNYQAIRQIEMAQEFAIALNAISREIGASEFTVQSQSNPMADPKPVTDPMAPVLKLMNHPNPLHDWQSFIETVVMLLLPTGNCYILKDPLSMAGTPMSLWLLRSDRTNPVRDDYPTAPIQAYVHYAEDGTRYVFPPDRIIHIKLPNAYTDYIGLGMVQLLQQTLEMDFRSMESNIQMFRQGGRLSTVIEGMDEDPDKLKETKNKIIEAHMGSENAHRVLLLTGTAKLNTQILNSQPKEADYKETRMEISRGIGGMMGVPPMIMGQLDNVNRSTATVQQQLFLKNAIWPMMRRLTPAFDQIVKLFNPSFKFAWPRVDVMDPETMAVMMKNGLEGGALSPNDAREKFLQMPRDKNDAMDKHYIQSTLLSIEDGAGLPPDPAQADPADPAKAETAPAKLARPAPMTEKGIKSRFPKGTQEQRRILNALKAARPKIEKAIAPVFERHIIAFGRLAATAMEKRGAPKGLVDVKVIVDGVMKAYDDSGTTAGLEKETQRLYTAQMAIASEDASSIFGVDTTMASDSVEIASASTSLAKRVTWMDETLKTKLASIVQDGTEQGLSPWEIANGTTDGEFIGIKQSFEDLAPEHAQLIARTETAHLQDRINLNAYAKMGVTVCDVIGCEDFVIMPGESFGCNSQGVPISACPINFHPNHNGATVPHLED